MIGNIIELLNIVESKGEFTEIAKGKNKLPETLKEAYQQFKNDLKCQRK